MLLGKCKISDLRIGQMVKSLKTGHLGYICGLKTSPSDRQESADIVWENGEYSFGVFFTCGENVEVLDMFLDEQYIGWVLGIGEVLRTVFKRI